MIGMITSTYIVPCSEDCIVLVRLRNMIPTPTTFENFLIELVNIEYEPFVLLGGKLSPYGTGVCRNNDLRHKERYIVILISCRILRVGSHIAIYIYIYMALYDDGRYFRRHRYLRSRAFLPLVSCARAVTYIPVYAVAKGLNNEFSPEVVVHVRHQCIWLLIRCVCMRA